MRWGARHILSCGASIASCPHRKQEVSIWNGLCVALVATPLVQKQTEPGSGGGTHSGLQDRSSSLPSSLGLFSSATGRCSKEGRDKEIKNEGVKRRGERNKLLAGEELFLSPMSWHMPGLQ